MSELVIGEIVMLNGIMMKHLGGGRFEPMPTTPPGEQLAKRFDVGGPLSGQPVTGGRDAT